MLGSMFQQAFYGGDKCRISRLSSAVQSALHWDIVEIAVHSGLQSIYRGGIDKKSHNSSYALGSFPLLTIQISFIVVPAQKKTQLFHFVPQHVYLAFQSLSFRVSHLLKLLDLKHQVSPFAFQSSDLLNRAFDTAHNRSLRHPESAPGDTQNFC